MHFATQVIHEGQQPEPVTGAVMPPIFMTSTYAQEVPGQTRNGYDYTRAGNPNFEALEKLLAALEKGKHCTVFSSGLGAITALLSTFQSGDRILVLRGVYGGTYRLFSSIFQRFGLEVLYLSADEIPQKLQEGASMLFLETPSNPLLEVADLTLLCQAAREAGALAVVDNTFATPAFQTPLDLGADAVVHSTTKYIGGHSDVVGGAIMTSSTSLKSQLDFNRMAMGLNPSPFDCWLTLRGVKTLSLRMRQHEVNARALAAHFDRHPMVKKVFYPGLPSHPDHTTAQKQMKGYGGMVSVEFDLSLQEMAALLGSLQLFTLAESLGGVESLVCQPATMTHASLPPEEREKVGITPGLVRFSCGIESTQDLISDVEQGLSQLAAFAAS